MKNFTKSFLVSSAVISLALVASGCGNGNGSNSPTSASRVVYTQTNQVVGNSIYAYNQATDGKLSFMGSYGTTGKGVAEPALAPTGVLDTDKSVIVNSAHTLLFTVNQGSDTIAVFHINGDGSLSPIQPTVPSRGKAPVSLALIRNDSVLVCLNSSLDPSRTITDAPVYTSFRVGSDGVLTPIANSLVQLPTVAPNGNAPAPSIVLPSIDGNLIFDGNFLGDQIRVLQVDADGVLKEALGSPHAPEDAIFTGITNPVKHCFGLGVHPTQRLLYVSYPLAKKIAIYSYDTAGALTLVGSVSNPGRAACWIAINKAGTRMYLTNAISGDVTVFDIGANPSLPVLLQDLNVTGTGVTLPNGNPQVNGNPWHLTIDAREEFIYVLAPRDLANTSAGQGNTIHVLKINSDGTLTEVPNSTIDMGLPIGTNPQGIGSI